MYLYNHIASDVFHHNQVLHSPKPATKMYFLSVQCLFPPILRGSILTLPRPCRSGETRLHSKDVGLPPPARERGPHLEKPPRGLGLVDSNPQILNPAMPPSSAKWDGFKSKNAREVSLGGSSTWRCSAKSGASTTLRAACVTRKSRGRARINKEEEKAFFVDVGGIFPATTGTGRKCLAGAEWSRERATTFNKLTIEANILCKRNLVGKPVEERESLQLSSFSPSSSVAVDLHTLVEKSHGSELFLNISSEILLLSIRCSLQTRRYIVTWVFHIFSLQYMMYPRCIKI